MIELHDISLQRGIRPLIKHSSLRIHPGEKIAVVGANGAGKTSLFKLLLGDIAVDSGKLTIPASWTIAHMAQEVSHAERDAVDYVIDGDKELRAIEAELPHAEDMALAELYGRLDAIDGYTAVTRAEQLLAGLGFRQEQLHAPINSLSGGWRIRLNLAQALMSRSDLLLLDEPTNHLDLDACLWLEQWINAYRGTMLLISHDRDFIDNTCDQVVHIDQQQLLKYRGNYSAFEVQRAEKLAQQQSAHEQQQRRIAHFQHFIERFKAKASKAKQAQSRVKALERMQVIAPAHVDSGFSFSFAPPGKTSDPLLHLDRGVCGYGQTVILDKINLAIHPGSRIALLGANGAGKSTLLRTLAGAQEILQGALTPGEHLRIGYFTQHQIETLDDKASAALHILRISPKATEQQIRDFLGSFNFRGDRALEPIEPFSGGEKARLALALICWQKPNLLLLDEPTNHLDLDMCEALTEALQDFEGAIVLVSHDRHLVRNTADELLLVHDGKVDEFDGDLDDYSRWLINTLREQKNAATKTEQIKKAGKPANNSQASAEIKELKKELNAIETRMSKLQQQLAAIEAQLGDSSIYEAKNKARLQELGKEQKSCEKALADEEERWLELQEKLEH